MLYGPITPVLPISPKQVRLTLKLALGVFLLHFFLNYHPFLGFPPIRKNIAKAQEPSSQAQKVDAGTYGISFQLPHPGYLSTPYSTYHPGIDIATGLGMPIRPIAKGTIVNTGYNFFGLGLVVEVDHGSGFKSLYAHMGRIYVEKGKTVAEGDILGEVGLTGNTTGPHTHLEVYKDGHTIDPRGVLPEIRQLPLAQDFNPVNQPKTTNYQPIAPKQIAYNPTPTTPIPTPKPIQKPNDLSQIINATKSPDPIQQVKTKLNLGAL